MWRVGKALGPVLVKHGARRASSVAIVRVGMALTKAPPRSFASMDSSTACYQGELRRSRCATVEHSLIRLRTADPKSHGEPDATNAETYTSVPMARETQQRRVTLHAAYHADIVIDRTASSCGDTPFRRTSTRPKRGMPRMRTIKNRSSPMPAVDVGPCFRLSRSASLNVPAMAQTRRLAPDAARLAGAGHPGGVPEPPVRSAGGLCLS